MAPVLTLHIARTVPATIEDLAQAFDVLPDRITAGRRTLVLQARPVPGDATSLIEPLRSAPATLGTGSLSPRFRVALEATAWSGTVSEVSIRSLGRAPMRRPESFCQAAHAVLDELTGSLLDLQAATSITGTRRLSVVDADSGTDEQDVIDRLAS